MAMPGTVHVFDGTVARPYSLLCKCFAEFIGTTAFVFVGTAQAHQRDHDRFDKFLHGALTHGFAMCVLALTLRHISGAHLNPAVSWAAALVGRLPFAHLAPYLAAQFLGGILGAFLTTLVLTKAQVQQANLGARLLVPGVKWYRGIFGEQTGTTFIMFVVLDVALDRPGIFPLINAPLLAGATIATNTVTLGDATGLAMNPARAFGPNLVGYIVMDTVPDGWWTNHFIFIAGPFTGATFAVLLHKALLWLCRLTLITRLRAPEEQARDVVHVWRQDSWKEHAHLRPRSRPTMTLDYSHRPTIVQNLGDDLEIDQAYSPRPTLVGVCNNGIRVVERNRRPTNLDRSLTFAEAYSPRPTLVGDFSSSVAVVEKKRMSNSLSVPQAYTTVEKVGSNVTDVAKKPSTNLGRSLTFAEAYSPRPTLVGDFPRGIAVVEKKKLSNSLSIHQQCTTDEDEADIKKKRSTNLGRRLTFAEAYRPHPTIVGDFSSSGAVVEKKRLSNSLSISQANTTEEHVGSNIANVEKKRSTNLGRSLTFAQAYRQHPTIVIDDKQCISHVEGNSTRRSTIMDNFRNSPAVPQAISSPPAIAEDVRSCISLMEEDGSESSTDSEAKSNNKASC